jgi:hypothetical protein
MKNDKKLDLMNSTSWKNEFWSHEIRPPDPESPNPHPNNISVFNYKFYNCNS